MRAYKLGAPIEESIDYHTDGHLITTGYVLNGDVNDKNLDGFGWANTLLIPTAEQMIGWLEEQGIKCTIFSHTISGQRRALVFINNNTVIADTGHLENTREATLAALDEALEYIETHNKKNMYQEDIRFLCNRKNCIYNNDGVHCDMFDELAGPEDIKTCDNYFYDKYI